MRENTLYKQLIAVFMLLTLLVVLLPRELWHHEHEAHTVCSDTQKHVEEKDVDCSICDYYFPSVLKQKQAHQDFFVSLTGENIIANHSELKKYNFNLPYLRGPPAIC